MAHVDGTGQQKGQEVPEAESGAEKSLVGRLLPWVVMIVVVALCAGAGFGLGRFFAGSSTSETAESEFRPDDSSQTENLKADDD